MAYVPGDKFAVKAKAEGYRARSAYKLLDLQKKFGLLKTGDKVLDLGAAPGSWMQVASGIVGDEGAVVGVDITPIEPLLQRDSGQMGLSNVNIFQKNVMDEDFVEFLKGEGYGEFDVVVSDVAPSTTGIKDRDQGLSHDLSVGILRVAEGVLKSGGNLVIKVFEGGETPGLLAEAKKKFSKVKLVKPIASTRGSKEVFLVARGFGE